MWKPFKHLISVNQHGIRSGLYTVINLLCFYSDIIKPIDGFKVDTIYTDFHKTFDSINLEILIFNLDNIRIFGNILDCYPIRMIVN